MLKRRAFIAAGGAAVLALAGCGSDSAGKDVEVFTWWAGGSEKSGLDALVRVFDEQHPDFAFVNGAVAGGAGSNAKNVLAARLQAGNPPDSFQAHAGKELADYITANQVQDLKGLYTENGWDKIFPHSLLDLLTVDGKIYSVPSNVHRANVVWANPAVLQRIGIDPNSPPSDLNGMFAALERAKAAGVTPLSVGKDWTQVHVLETVLLSKLGAAAYVGLFDGKTAWDAPQLGAAVDDYARLMSYANTDRLGLDWADATQQIIDGTAAFNIMGDWAAAGFAGQKQAFGTDYVAFPVPGTDGVFDFLADSFTLPVGAENEAGTRAWLQTVASQAGQKAFNTAKGSIPARNDAAAADYPAYQRTAIAAYTDGTIVPSIAHGAAVSIAWLTEITSAVSEFSVTNDVGKLKTSLAAAAAKHRS